MLQVEEKLKDIKAPDTRTINEIVTDVNINGGSRISIVIELLKIITYLVDRLVFTDSERFNH